MQSKNKNDSIQFPTRYQCYDFAKRHLREKSEPKIFPIKTSNEKNEMEINILGHKDCYRRANQVYDKDGIIETLSTCGGGGQHPCISVSTPTGQDRHEVVIIDKKGNKKNKDYASTLTGGGHSGGNHSDMDLILERKKDKIGRMMPLHRKSKAGIRRLTPTECERLQGFPDNWTKKGIDKNGNEIKISDTQRYRSLGNAVTTNVIKAIMERLLIYI